MKLESLVPTSIGCGAWDRPVSAQTFTGGSTLKCLNNFFLTQIEISINNIGARREDTLTFIDIIVTFCYFGSFSCNRFVVQNKKY